MKSSNLNAKTKILSLFEENVTFQKILYAVIVIDVISIILESYEDINAKYSLLFEIIEIISVVIFSLEYILRIWIANINPKNNNNRMNFILSKLGVIDLIAIIPFYLPMIFPIDLRMIRVLRLSRLLRIFKLGRFSKSLKTISSVIKDTKSDLIITFFVAFILLLLSSTLMYYVENEAQPIKFANIGQSFWWAVATLTTVGYGDVYPITGLGKLLSGVIAIIGIGFVALPTGIISSAFIARLKKKKKMYKCQCPNCGHNYEEKLKKL